MERRENQREIAEHEFEEAIRTAVGVIRADEILASLGVRYCDLTSENIQLQVESGVRNAQSMEVAATGTLARRSAEITKTYKTLLLMHTWFTKVGFDVRASINDYLK